MTSSKSVTDREAESDSKQDTHHNMSLSGRIYHNLEERQKEL